MAINNTNVVNFLYAGPSKTASTAAGTISFVEDSRQIFVGDGTKAIAFAGNVKNATYVENVLKISFNDGSDDISLDFGDVASAKNVMAVFQEIYEKFDANDKAHAALNTAVTDITKADGAIATAVKEEKDAREAADTSINNKIGVVPDGSTVVGMIAEAKAAAIASGTAIVKDSDFLTLESSVGENGATTYTIGTSDIAKASDLAKTDASLAQEISDRATAITDAVAALNSSVNDSDDAGFVSVSVTEAAGKLTAIEVTTNDIAKATDLDDVSTRVKTNADAIATLNGDGAGSVKKQVSDAIADVVNSAPEAFDTLGEIASWIANDQTGAAAMSAQIAAHTTAIADNSTAIANLDASYKAADTSIRNDFAAADTSVLNAAKDYAKTAVEQTHTHTNKALLDTYTQTEENLADAVAKKHSHDNKDVLDGISSAKVTAWDSAEQNAKNYADGLAGNYATAAQGAKADSAVQSITTGGTNGTINVDGTEVAVKGLGSAAYTDAGAYDAAGTGSAAAASALTDAKAYSDAKTVNGKTGHAITLTGADVSVGGQGTHAAKKVDAAIEELYTAVGVAAEAGVQTFSVAADSSKFAEVDKNAGQVSFKIKRVAIAESTETNYGVANSWDVKNYVDTAIQEAAMKWEVA